jgi:hypothetical protein
MADMLEPGGDASEKERRLSRLSYSELYELVEVILKECYSQDLLSSAEYENRITLFQKAATKEQLVKLIRDLPVDLPVQRRNQSLPPLLHTSRHQNISVILGEKTVYGGKLNSRYTDGLIFMGEVKIDYREVDLPPGTTTLKLTGIMSETTIIVPPDLCVVSDIAQIMASVNEDKYLNTRPVEGKPVLKIIGFILMAEVKIKVKELYE